ncbi:MBL fold metallo-hydrolase [Pontibacillus yanchengensis]|uniref:Metallo-beta-lactamase domain-containing protein n=1 Tax=Pontibacillus yanchengensis Y32 TaxID=1385514 RepID=A0A0A2TJR4_9BACI|nr:MBL fold metallo-hydrolase [Pontibacillus yanchengensis]KGP74316.1 hypothetical protein N782_15310 [Pontibacillus yanchengensis Y32]
MYIKQIRNATLIITFADKKFLIDPFLAEQGSMPPFPDTPNQDLNNPLVELPVSKEELIDVDAVIVTHLHPDHFDDAAKEMLPKDMFIYAQNEADLQVIQEAGFTNVQSFEKGATMEGVDIFHTNGQHGSREMTEITGKVSGIVFAHKNEKPLYIAGDTIWCDDVKEAIHTHQPEVIVVNAGAAQFLEGGPITMTKEDVHQTQQEAPNATVIVSHMEALNHCLLTRNEMHQYLEEQGLENIVIPKDGEQLFY